MRQPGRCSCLRRCRPRAEPSGASARAPPRALRAARGAGRAALCCRRRRARRGRPPATPATASRRTAPRTRSTSSRPRPRAAASLFDGPTRFADVLRLGDFGLGGTSPLEGEVIVARRHRLAREPDRRRRDPPPTARTPFAFVKHFRAERRVELPGGRRHGRAVARARRGAAVAEPVLRSAHRRRLRLPAAPQRAAAGAAVSDRSREVVRGQNVFAETRSRARWSASASRPTSAASTRAAGTSTSWTRRAASAGTCSTCARRARRGDRQEPRPDPGPARRHGLRRRRPGPRRRRRRLPGRRAPARAQRPGADDGLVGARSGGDRRPGGDRRRGADHREPGPTSRAAHGRLRSATATPSPTVVCDRDRVQRAGERRTAGERCSGERHPGGHVVARGDPDGCADRDAALHQAAVVHHAAVLRAGRRGLLKPATGRDHSV